MAGLSKRLAAVASLVPPGKVIADIGTDHGFLPVFLVKSGISPRVIASDINRGPLEKARRLVCSEGLEDRIAIRSGNGLQVLHPGEAQVVVIAGLGGHTLVDILSNSPEILETVETLVLNPATHQSVVRRWLLENGWCLREEDLVEDQGRFYQIIVACRGTQPEAENWTQLEYDTGPLILQKRHPLLKEYLKTKLKKYVKAAENMKQSDNASTKEKLLELETAIRELRVLYASLS